MFRALSVEEKLHCLNFGMIASSYDTEITAERSEWYGLFWEYEANKFNTDEEFEPSKINGHYSFQQELLEDFLICGCLINENVVTHAGNVQHAPSVETGGMFVGGTTGRAIANGNIRFNFKDDSHILTEDDTRRFLQIWQYVRKQKMSKGGRQIVNAARRLHYSETRFKSEDILVDLMIAAESLYLDGEDKGELSYRLSLNTALWETDDQKQRKAVFSHFRKAYALRSKVVHGAKISEPDVSEVVVAVKPLIKRAILKAIEMLSTGKALPKWDDLMFAPESFTES